MRVLEVDLLYLLQLLESLLVLLLLCVHIGHHCEDLCVTHMVSSKHFNVHFQRFLQERKGIFEITSLHVALAKQSQDLAVELFCLLMLLKQRSIQLKGRSQVVKGLFIVLVIEIGFSKLRISLH